MASIRKLKKDVNYLSHELMTEVFAYKHFHPDMAEDKFDEIIKNLVKKRNEIISRINHPEESKDLENLNHHYSRIKEEMEAMIKELDKLK
ncbi:MAG: hypothetical protein ACOCWA_03285 [Bacteroidota bacterium]